MTARPHSLRLAGNSGGRAAINKERAALRHFPNFLTALRMAAARELRRCFSPENFRSLSPSSCWPVFSDAADGYLARRYGLVTRFGRYLDPAADKALMLAVFVSLALIGESRRAAGRSAFLYGSLRW